MGCSRSVFGWSSRLWLIGSLILCAGFLRAQQTQDPTPPPNTAPANQKPPVPVAAPKTPKPQTTTPRTDEIDQARKALTDAASTARGKPLALDAVAKRTVEVGRTLTFRVVARNPSLQSSSVLTYSLEGAPEGATIDTDTGTVAWTPTTRGLFTFIAAVTDNGEPPRRATTPITIEVTNPLEPFGYSFFRSARALIDSRMAAVRAASGQTNASNTQTAATMPVVTKKTATSETNGDEVPVNAKEKPATSQKTTPPSPPASTPGENTPNADALRYFVGPFDMLGLNVFVPAPERYQLGAGDVLTIRYWSPALDAREVDVKVDAQGQIAVPESGQRLVVRGQSLTQAEAALRRAIRTNIRNAEVSMSLRALRTMSITVLGDAYLPGNYQVPAVATLFNALYMFGGPSDSGSLRQIELRRTDGSTLKFDLYKFLVYGDAKQDVPLQPGDTIWIPAAGPRITIQGEVARPGIYEAAKGERLRTLIGFAGGPKATGVAQRVSLQTVEPSVGRQLRDIDLSDSSAADVAVFDGDVATVAGVREQYTNAITLDGAVDQPGQYAAVRGTTVADLIARARGLLPEAYTARADLFRRNADKTQTLIPIDLDRALARQPGANIALEPYDRLVVYSMNDVRWMGDRQVTIRGAVQRPGAFYRADNMHVIDLLLQAGGLTPDAFTQEMFLQRTEPNGQLGPLEKLDFRRVTAGDPSANILLQDKDVLTVQTVTEARYTPDASVSIMGAVQAPGSYPRGSNMRLSDLLKLAGGTLPDASDSVEITNARVSIQAQRTKVRISDALGGSDDPALKDGDLVTIASRTDIQLTPKKIILMGAVAQPGPYAVNGSTDKLSDLIARAGGFAPNAYPEGAQFFRDPKLLVTVSQDRISPRIEAALRQVNQESYLRALAKSQVDKARVLKSLSGSTGIAIPGIGATPTDAPVSVPQSLLDQSTVSPARALTDDDLQAGGNINVDLPNALKHHGSSDDLVLQDGDIIVIPNKPTTVSVVGAVTVPSAVLFVPGKNIDFYVNRSGGFSSDAAKDQVLLIRYKGLVVKPTGRTTVELGDIIWVPTKVVAERLSDKSAEIDAVSKNVLSGALVFAILKSLFR